MLHDEVRYHHFRTEMSRTGSLLHGTAEGNQTERLWRGEGAGGRGGGSGWRR